MVLFGLPRKINPFLKKSVDCGTVFLAVQSTSGLVRVKIVLSLVESCAVRISRADMCIVIIFV